MALVLRIETLKRVSLHVFVSSVCVAAVTAFFEWQRIDDSIVGLVFLTGVVVAASIVGVWLSFYVGLLCALSFWYYFVPPVDSFQLNGVQEWTEVLSFVASSLIVSRVADRARKQAQQAEIRRADVERLYTLSQEMMLHDDANLLMRDLPQMIGKTFGLDDVVLYVREQDRFYGSAAELSRGVDEEMRARVSWYGAASPEEFSSIALMLGMKNLGTMAWKPDILSRDAAAAIAAQVSVALTRAAAIEIYTRMEASREGERLRTALIDSLTHELRTPLTGIRAAATTLVHGEGLDEPVRRDLISLVDEESARLDKLIGEAVEMAEVDARAVTVNAAPHFVRTLFEQALEESHAALVSHPVTIDIDELDSPAWFDSQLLSRVLRHLIENAARYSPSGSPITLRSYRDSVLNFSVEDCGPGIDAADLPLIFEKFYRGRQGQTTGKGTGMGLAITRAILAAHGGGIDAETSLGKGTRFHFWIPLIEKQPESA
jgi:two-component system, OmpR family, sensor histidine kinase KdpD